MGFFEYINAICDSKEDIMVDDVAEKEYNAFMVNRGLSQHADTAILANVMNRYHHIDNRLQFDFLRGTVRKGKRYGKWAKADKIESIEIIKEWYGYSNGKAEQVLKLFPAERIEEMKARLDKGGKGK